MQITISEALYRKLQAQAEREGRTVQEVVEARLDTNPPDETQTEESPAITIEMLIGAFDEATQGLDLPELNEEDIYNTRSILHTRFVEHLLREFQDENGDKTE